MKGFMPGVVSGYHHSGQRMNNDLFTILILSMGIMLHSTVRAVGMVFTDVTQSAGITHQHIPGTSDASIGGQREHDRMAGGAAAEDFDGDGWVDLFVLGGFQSPPIST
jgi:hypothetical protein